MNIREAVRSLLIRELGDSRNVADYRMTDSWKAGTDFEYKFEFESDSGTKYEVNLVSLVVPDYPYQTFAEVDFAELGGLYDTLTGKNEYAQIMATVIDICANVYEDRDALGINLDGFYFEAYAKDPKKTRQKKRLYKTYAKTQFPKAEFEEDSADSMFIWPEGKYANESLVTELGDTTEAYDLNLIQNSGGGREHVVEYEFQTKAGTSYIVELEAYDDPDRMVSVGFYPTKSQSYSDVTNEGDPFRIVATVVKAASEFWDLLHETGIDDDWEYKIERFYFSASGHSAKKVKQREKLYMAFIKRQFPSASIKPASGGAFYVTP